MLRNMIEKENVKNRNGKQRQKQVVRREKNNVNLESYNQHQGYRIVSEVIKRLQ